MRPSARAARGLRVLYFVAEAPGVGRELWSSDGTPAGTTLVADLVPGPASSLPQELTLTGGELLFSAWTPAFGREPFRVAAPGGVPQRLADIASGPRSSSPIRFHAVGGHLFTLANDGSRGFELWRIAEEGLIFRDGFASGDLESWSAVAAP